MKILENIMFRLSWNLITPKKNFKKIVNIGTPPFHLDLWAKKFSAYVDKMFLFPSVVHVFHIAQKLQNPNLQSRYGHQDNSECEIISEELSDYLF